MSLSRKIRLVAILCGRFIQELIEISILYGFSRRLSRIHTHSSDHPAQGLHTGNVGYEVRFMTSLDDCSFLLSRALQGASLVFHRSAELLISLLGRQNEHFLIREQ